jgi:hypothetical protein
VFGLLFNASLDVWPLWALSRVLLLLTPFGQSKMYSVQKILIALKSVPVIITEEEEMASPSSTKDC